MTEQEQLCQEFAEELKKLSPEAKAELLEYMSIMRAQAELERITAEG